MFYKQENKETNLQNSSMATQFYLVKRYQDDHSRGTLLGTFELHEIDLHKYAAISGWNDPHIYHRIKTC